MVDDDCGAGTEGYCVPAPGGVLPGSCYAPKHRYLSIAFNPDQVAHTARRVCLDGGECLGWVGAPSITGGLMISRMSATPRYADADFSGEWPDLVHLSACEVASDQVYVIQAIAQGQDTGDEGNYSEGLLLTTPTTWGDTVSTCFNDKCLPPDGAGGIDDILAAIAKFQGVDNAPMTWLDVASSSGSDVPNQQINISDIFAALDGFQGKVYPGLGPLGCP